MKDITITVPGFRASIPKEKLNVHTLEEMALELAIQIGKQVMIKTLKEVDDGLMKERDKENLKNQGLRARYLTTRLGDISFKRRAYYDSARKLRYLLDEDMGLEKNRRVTVQREKIESALAATSESYRDAQMRCEAFFGGSRSHETIRSQVIREGKRIERKERNLAKSEISNQASSPARDMVIVEVDGTPIHLQKKDRKLYRRRMAEVRLGVAYTGWERRYRGGNGKQVRLKDKYVYGEVGTDGNGFMERLSSTCEERYGISKAKVSLVGGDGAWWIREGQRDWFPNSQLCLCKYHLQKALTDTLGYSKEIRNHIKRLIAKKDLLGVKKVLDKERIKAWMDEKKTEKIAKLKGYLIDNWEAIDGVRKAKKKNPHLKSKLRNTGAIEGNIDKVIANRFKKRGRGWSMRGASGLLKVGTKIRNGDWDSWWREERSQPLPEVLTKEEIKQLIPDNLRNDSLWDGPDEADIPILRGPFQGYPYVESIRELVGLVKVR